MSETRGHSRSQPRNPAKEPRLAEWYDDYVRKFSRRKMFRAGVDGGAALAANGLVLPGAASASPGPTVLLTGETVPGSALRPFGRHLAYGADSATQVVVTWQTPAKVTAPYLR